MDENSNQNEMQEIVTPEATAQTVDTHSQEQTSQPDQQEKDWVKRLRKDREDYKRQAEQERNQRLLQEELLKKLMTQQPSAQESPEEDIIQELAKEEYVPGEKVAKGLRKMEEKFNRELQEVKNQYAQKQAVDAFTDLRREYADFDDVVNVDTLAIVKEKNPRLAQAWSKLDDYSIAVQAYPYIKNAGIVDNVSSVKGNQEVDRKIEQNKKTVPSPQVFEKRPLAQAFDYNRLSKQQQQDLQKEMMHYASMAGGY